MALPEPNPNTNVKNSTARIWTNAELNVTKKQAKANGFIVSKQGFGGTITITDPSNDEVILRSMKGPGAMNLVRINQGYFAG
jgi:hypothetical protein